MKDIRTHYERKKGWWLETRSTIPCALPPDGLIVVFRREDAEELMDRLYPHEVIRGEKVWFFNSTKDREIAEIDVEGRISANPNVLWEHFLRR